MSKCNHIQTGKNRITFDTWWNFHLYFIPHFSPHVLLVYGMNLKINSPLFSDFGDISVISNVVWEQRIVSPLIPHNPLLCSTPCCIRGGIYILKEKHFHFHKRKKSLSPEYLQGVQQKKFQISKDSKFNGVSPFPAGCAR